MNNNPIFAKFFPEKVYRCDCLAKAIASCLANQACSLKDICEEVNKIDGEKIYCVKCGENEQDLVLSCGYHMPIAIFAVKSSSTGTILVDKTKNCCLTCIKKYLQEMYHIFGHENFKKN